MERSERLKGLETLISAPDVSDIVLQPGACFVARSGSALEPQPAPIWTDDDIRLWILEALSRDGKTWDARFPFADFLLSPRVRVHVVFPPISASGLAVSIRKPALSRTSTPQETWGKTETSARALQILLDAVRARESIVVAGGTGAGKTTLLRDLIEACAPSDRIIGIEDVRELWPRHPHFISLETRPSNADGCGAITARDCFRQTLRMRPDRLVLGECRGAEIFDLAQALSTGHRGGFGTVHASSARHAFQRLELLAALQSEIRIHQRAFREVLVGAIQWIAFVDRSDKGRVISEIVHIEGLEGDTVLFRPMLQAKHVRNANGGAAPLLPCDATFEPHVRDDRYRSMVFSGSRNRAG